MRVHHQDITVEYLGSILEEGDEEVTSEYFTVSKGDTVIECFVVIYRYDTMYGERGGTFAQLLGSEADRTFIYARDPDQMPTKLTIDDEPSLEASDAAYIASILASGQTVHVDDSEIVRFFSGKRIT